MDISDSVCTNINELDETMGSILSTPAGNEEQKSDSVEPAGTIENPDLPTQIVEVNELETVIGREDSQDNCKVVIDNVTSCTETSSENDTKMITIEKPSSSEEVTSSNISSQIEEHEELWLGDNTRQLVKVDTDEDFEVIVKSLETAIVETDRYDIDTVITTNEEPVVSPVASNTENSLRISGSDSLLADIPSNLLTSAVPEISLQGVLEIGDIEIPSEISTSQVENSIAEQIVDSYDPFVVISEPKIDTFDEQSSDLFETIDPEIVPVESEPSLLELQEATIPVNIPSEFQGNIEMHDSMTIDSPPVEGEIVEQSDLENICAVGLELKEDNSEEYLINKLQRENTRIELDEIHRVAQEPRIAEKPEAEIQMINIEQESTNTIFNKKEIPDKHDEQIVMEKNEPNKNDESELSKKLNIEKQIAHEFDELSKKQNLSGEICKTAVELIEKESVPEVNKVEKKNLTAKSKLLDDVCDEEMASENFSYDEEIIEYENEIEEKNISAELDKICESSVDMDFTEKGYIEETSSITSSIVAESPQELEDSLTGIIPKAEEIEKLIENRNKSLAAKIEDISEIEAKNINETIILEKNCGTSQIKKFEDHEDEANHSSTHLEKESDLNADTNFNNKLVQTLENVVHSSSKADTSKKDSIYSDIQLESELDIFIEASGSRNDEDNMTNENITQVKQMQEHMNQTKKTKISENVEKKQEKQKIENIEPANTENVEITDKNLVKEQKIENVEQTRTENLEVTEKISEQKEKEPDIEQSKIENILEVNQENQKVDNLKRALIEVTEANTNIFEDSENIELTKGTHGNRIENKLEEQTVENIELISTQDIGNISKGEQEIIIQSAVKKQEIIFTSAENLGNEFEIGSDNIESQPTSEKLPKKQVIEDVKAKTINAEEEIGTKSPNLQNETFLENSEDVVIPEKEIEDKHVIKPFKHSLDADKNDQSPPKKIKLVREKFKAKSVDLLKNKGTIPKAEKISYPEIIAYQEKNIVLDNTVQPVEDIIPEQSIHSDKMDSVQIKTTLCTNEQISNTELKIIESSIIVEGKESIEQILEKLEDPADKISSPVKPQKLKLQRNYKLPQKTAKQTTVMGGIEKIKNMPTKQVIEKQVTTKNIESQVTLHKELITDEVKIEDSQVKSKQEEILQSFSTNTEKSVTLESQKYENDTNRSEERAKSFESSKNTKNDLPKCANLPVTSSEIKEISEIALEKQIVEDIPANPVYDISIEKVELFKDVFITESKIEISSQVESTTTKLNKNIQSERNSDDLINKIVEPSSNIDEVFISQESEENSGIKTNTFTMETFDNIELNLEIKEDLIPIDTNISSSSETSKLISTSKKLEETVKEISEVEETIEEVGDKERISIENKVDFPENTEIKSSDLDKIAEDNISNFKILETEPEFESSMQVEEIIKNEPEIDLPMPLERTIQNEPVKNKNTDILEIEDNELENKIDVEARENVKIKDIEFTKVIESKPDITSTVLNKAKDAVFEDVEKMPENVTFNVEETRFAVETDNVLIEKHQEKLDKVENIEIKYEVDRAAIETKDKSLLKIDTEFPLLSLRLQEKLKPKVKKINEEVNIAPVLFPTLFQENVSKKLQEQFAENKSCHSRFSTLDMELKRSENISKSSENTWSKEIPPAASDHLATMESATKIKITKRKLNTPEPMIRSVTKPLSVQIDDIESSDLERSHSCGSSGQKDQENIPKLVIKPIHKPEGRSSPKITIKPIKPPEENVSKSRSSEESSHSPKITIKPIVKPDPLKITITKQKSDDTHSILKIYQPEDNQTQLSEQSIPKLSIKSIPKSDEMQHSPRITIKAVKPSPTSSMSPKITVKPIQSPNEQVEITHSPKVTVKPVVNSEESYPKVTIKPVLRPEETHKVSPVSPRQIKLKSMTFESSSGVTVEPICSTSSLPTQKMDPENQISPLKISVKSFAKIEESLSPKLSIKPITKTCEIVQSEDGTSNPLKLTIKPILKPEETSYQSPKITIKPIVKPDEVQQVSEELDKPERIILKIQKTNLPSPKERIKDTRKEPEVRIEAVTQDSERGQKLDKIKLKLTKEGSHAQIIPTISTSGAFALKRSLEMSDPGIMEKRSKTEFPGSEILHTSDISINLVEPNAKPCPKTISEEVTIMKIDKTCSNKDFVSEQQISQSKFKEMLMKIQQKSDITCTPQMNREKENSSSSDDVEIVGVIENEPLKDPLSLHDESSSQDLMIVSEVINTNPFHNIQVVNTQTISPQTPKKRGRPRKNPLEPKPEIKGEDCIEVEQVRPKRTCRAPPGRTPFAVKERKPRGAGRARGSPRGRGGAKTPQKPPKEPKPSPRSKALKEAKALAKVEATRLAQEIIIDEITIEDSTNDTPAATPIPPIEDSPKKLEVKESEPILPQMIEPTIPQMVEPEVKVSQISEELLKQPPPPAVYEEETRMSAENSSRAQTPAQQVFIAPLTEGPEESQSSVQSTATTESSKAKKGRLEPIDPDSAVTTVDQIVEYSWNNGGPYMLQEQIAQFLGVKSFKRKYPGLTRRFVEMQERDYIREKGLVSESMCDMGLTAVPSTEILDIMYSDFQEKYEEYRKYLRDKQAKEISNKQKAVSLATSQEKNKIDFKERAIKSAASWNLNFNKARKDSRKCCVDLQTFTINYPTGKIKVPHKNPVGHYPLALVPGQYTDYYKPYSTHELNYLPLNTVRYGPMLPNLHCDPSQSDGSQSDSDSSSGSDSDSSDESMSTEEDTPQSLCKPVEVQLSQLITPKSKVH